MLHQPAHVFQIEVIDWPKAVGRDGHLGGELPLAPLHMTIEKTQVGAASVAFARQVQPTARLQLDQVAPQFLLGVGRGSQQAEGA